MYRLRVTYVYAEQYLIGFIENRKPSIDNDKQYLITGPHGNIVLTGNRVIEINHVAKMEVVK